MSFYDLINGTGRLDASFYVLNALAAHRLLPAPFRQQCLKRHYSRYPPAAVAFIVRAWCDRSGTHARRSAGR